MKTIRLLAAALAAPLTAVALSAAAQRPPLFPAGDAADTYFGTVVPDPYRALENTQDPKVAPWMKSQADYARAVLDSMPGRKALLERVTMYDDAVAARVINVRRRPNGLVFYEKRGVKDNQFKLYVRESGADGKAGAERLLFDPEALEKRTGKPHAINWFEPSHTGRYVAYGISAAGSEDADLYVIETDSGKPVLGPVTRANYASVAWLQDDVGFFFMRLQEMKPGMPAIEKYQKPRNLLVRLTEDVEKAPSVLAFDTPGVSIDPTVDFPAVGVLPDNKTAIGVVYRGTDRELEVYAAALDTVLAGKPAWRKVVDRKDAVTAFEVVGDRLFALTYTGASRFRLLETSLRKPDLANAKVVIAEGDGVLTGLVQASDGLYVSRRDGAVSRLLKLPLAPNAKAAEVKLPVAGSFEFAGVDYRLPGVLLTLQSWTRGPQIYQVAAQGAVTNTGLQPQGKYDAVPDYVSTEVLVPSHDGAKVPLSIIHKRGLKLDGSNPTILYGYASYGITEEPWFSAWRLAWLERGGVFAVANPRGSGAFGQDWYKAGFQSTKPNTWKDFIATAEYLIAQKYTTSAKLGIWGGSAGGILVGRSFTERPDLFAAAVPAVGALDMVRAELTPNGLPNIPEFGTHKTETGFRALLAMSTYNQIKDGVKYPGVMFTHGVNDPRVEVWQSTKTAARLMAATQGGPVLLRLSYDSGHGIGDTKKQRQEERADVLAFMLWQFGVAEFQPAVK